MIPMVVDNEDVNKLVGYLEMMGFERGSAWDDFDRSIRVVNSGSVSGQSSGYLGHPG
jgi:hypothetical protein